MSDNHDKPRQRETQRCDSKQRSAPRQRSQSRRRRSPARQRHGNPKEDRTHTVTQSPALDETFESLSFDSVNNESGDTRDEIFAMINITLEDRPHIPATLKAKVDTGASGNILPLRIFRRMYPTKLNAEGFPAERTLVPQPDCVQWYTHTTVWHNDYTLHLSWQTLRRRILCVQLHGTRYSRVTVVQRTPSRRDEL